MCGIVGSQYYILPCRTDLSQQGSQHDEEYEDDENPADDVLPGAWIHGRHLMSTPLSYNLSLWVG